MSVNSLSSYESSDIISSDMSSSDISESNDSGLVSKMKNFLKDQNFKPFLIISKNGSSRITGVSEEDESQLLTAKCIFISTKVLDRPFKCALKLWKLKEDVPCELITIAESYFSAQSELQNKIYEKEENEKSIFFINSFGGNLPASLES
jgi:hypothetical protein